MFTLVKESFKGFMGAITLIAMIICVYGMFNMDSEAVLLSFIVFMIGAHFVDAEDQ